MGVWIETSHRIYPLFKFESHPTWVCGLKLRNTVITENGYSVTPYVGVWIETILISLVWILLWVTPYVGVWIETQHLKGEAIDFKSHPTWVCGLKLMV